jgi:dTDP-4-amino-4,6-dideoxygalactose transaminase
MIPVNKPNLPDFSDYTKLLEGIWDRRYLTNNGPLVQQLEKLVEKHLSSCSMRFVTNGTMALQLAIKALNLNGEIITTPFSYVATSTAIRWENCVPIYVDIDSATFNIDPKLIEAAITPRTTAILATHVFGNPCDVVEIDEIAKRHNLKVIYDGAHAFGINYLGQSIFNYGDITICSFHATKIFHCIEGGGVFSKHKDLLRKIDLLRNFGHDGDYKFNGIGINAKQSEFHAAMGLVNLDYVDLSIQHRVHLIKSYRKMINVPNLKYQKWVGDNENGGYFPVVVSGDLNTLIETLSKKGIESRRYFYPSLDTLGDKIYLLPISHSISSRIICLPLFSDLKEEEVRYISETFNNSLR